MKIKLSIFALTIAYCQSVFAQIVINEGSNKNASSITDEDGELSDWIEIYNAGSDAVDLAGYSLSDNASQSGMWTFPHYVLQPGQFLVVFCSSKNRYASPPAITFNYAEAFTPQAGWNNHPAQQSFIWDGISNLVLNTCSYWSGGYTSNSIFNQTATDYVASVSSYADGGDYACYSQYGETSNLRPVLRINDVVVGQNDAQNCNTCYPAPYGNWYFGARMQTIYRAADLLAAGVTPGPIDSIAFDVAATAANYYDYINIQLSTTAANELSFEFQNTSGSYFHTNFSIAGTGETIYLFNSEGNQEDSMEISLQSLNTSIGSFPDASSLDVLFAIPTPGSTNNNSEPAAGYTLQPSFNVNPGFYLGAQSVSILNPNGPLSVIRYTTDGSEPQTNSALYSGSPISIQSTTVLKARAFEANHIPGPSGVASYFIGADHSTPILSISTANENLYGAEGMFDNPFSDWLKSGYVEYFDSTDAHNLLMSQYTGMIMDGGAGGSRSQPQRSFRLKLADGIFGEAPMEHQVIPTVPYRNQYSDFYLRNGSNQYLALPYKDAAQVRMMCEGNHTYFSGWRPVTVYINGQYHGLYELREKFNAEKFEIQDNASRDSMDILSLSYYYGGILRAVEGDPQHYWDDWGYMSQLDATSPDYISQISSLLDLDNYTDYIIGESFMANVDWPYNNIKIYRSDAPDYKWRFAIQDLELGLAPNSWTDCYTNHIEWLMGNTNGNPFTTAWYNMMQQDSYRLHFVNRFADLMNTSYRADRLLAIEQYHYNMVLPEMPAYYARWADPNNIPGYMNWFNENHNVFRDQLACRGTQVRNHIQNQFGYASQQEITLDVYPPEAGTIQINTIIPDELPWTGIYFNGAPVTVTAIANPGYVFNYWLSDSLLQSPWHSDSLIINFSVDDILTAHFIGLPQPLKIDISEINYNDEPTHPTGDWIELHNSGNGTVNLTGWSLTNGVNMPRFEFPAGTLLAPNQYLVVAHDLESFQALHPDVSNVIGNFDFALPQSGGIIRLLNYHDDIIREVSYLDTLPWPMVADGGGRTLEYSIGATNPSDAENWFAGCMFGSPGAPYMPCMDVIVISEINYESSPNTNSGDWIELRNTSNTIVDISNWKVRDSEWNNEYTVPAGIVLAPGASWVICQSTAIFDGIHPQVANRSGDFDFNLSTEGELLRVYDATEKIKFSVYYQSNNPWPTEPNASGYTLEWNASEENVNSPQAWFAGCVLGSPGTEFIQCDSTSSVQSIETIHPLAYPNPSESHLFVQLPANFNTCEIKLFNINGQCVHFENTSNKNLHRIQTDAYPAGMYLLQIVAETNHWNQPIIISH
ncbi:MAG: lamin tail domain-containing protein [Flavobacteriales bacterium]